MIVNVVCINGLIIWNDFIKLEEYYLLGYDAMYVCSRYLPVFKRNTLPPYSSSTACTAHLLTLQMKAVCSSKMPVNTRLPDVTSQDIVLFIPTPMRTSNLAYFHLSNTNPNEEPRVVIMQCEAPGRQHEALWFVTYNTAPTAKSLAASYHLIIVSL